MVYFGLLKLLIFGAVITIFLFVQQSKVFSIKQCCEYRMCRLTARKKSLYQAYDKEPLLFCHLLFTVGSSKILNCKAYRNLYFKMKHPPWLALLLLLFLSLVNIGSQWGSSRLRAVASQHSISKTNWKCVVMWIATTDLYVLMQTVACFHH